MQARFSVAVLLFLAATAGILNGQPPSDSATEPGDPTEVPHWIPLFDGRSLDGWIPKIRRHPLGADPQQTFRVVDGLLTVSYDNYTTFEGQFGHLHYHRPFSHYRLRLEYRFLGEQVEGGAGWAWRNSGIMIHGQTPSSMALDQSFPVSIEVQLLGGKETGQRPTANLCTPGTHVVMDDALVTRHCTSSGSPTFRGDEWVSVELEVRGNKIIRHFVNGQEVLHYEQPQLDPDDEWAKPLIQDPLLIDSGYISLQSEGHPIQFRRIEVMHLPAAKPAQTPPFASNGPADHGHADSLQPVPPEDELTVDD